MKTASYLFFLVLMAASACIFGAVLLVDEWLERATEWLEGDSE